MALHVDIIKTDPLASGEHCLARATYNGSVVDIESSTDAAYWRSTLAIATTIDPDTDPQNFFEALPTALDGTYVYATAPHEDDECPLTHPAAAG